ncbi:MAG TPA: SpoIIE family protein phosphatase [Candidatus Sulfotelmatobacter sp.]|nr:SpoIIE family protein phosphatase [Candidatus Sulfotelmatobacter sp.]
MGETRKEWIDEVAGILETLNQGVVINDDCNKIVFANQIFLRMLGRPPEQVLGRTVTEMYPAEDAAALKEKIDQRHIDGQGQYEFYLPQPGGGRMPVLVTSRQIEDLDGALYAVITATDISEQKRAENALRDANLMLEKRQREIEEDLQLAASVQLSLAPKSIQWGKTSVETYYQAARTIGGDFGLVTPTDDALHILVCDVSGHGIGSALVANRIYTETMAQIRRGADLPDLFRHLNRFVMSGLGSSVFFFTVGAARLDRDARTLELAGAGHPPAMVVHPGEKPQLVESRSAVLGLLPDAVDVEASTELQLEPGDRVVIYTDGFTECFTPARDMLGVEGLSEIVRETSKLPLGEMRREIVDRVAAWRNGPADDDMSLVLVEAP